jgi:hypothetical protein
MIPIRLIPEKMRSANPAVAEKIRQDKNGSYALHFAARTSPRLKTRVVMF